jgi:tRNA U34 5-methylaminomethyl-2-thiouridine-forming methyltransferase MnmC
MKDLKKIVRKTNDGSYTIYMPDLDENYHSIHGAMQESNHVFLKEGLNLLDLNSIDVFEVGFGTGLNAYLTYHESEKRNLKVNYVSIEAFPLVSNLVEQYVLQINDQEFKDSILKLHSIDWEREVQLSACFSLKKINTKLESMNLLADSFDIIYYDAFGPRVQPEMWTFDLFCKMFQMLRNGGFLVTYCAKGQVKRELRQAGFEVETCQGPPGKREMIRAWKR